MTFFVPFGDQVSRKRTILVSGATGVVGTVLRPQLRRHRLVAQPPARHADVAARPGGTVPGRHQVPGARRPP